MKIPAIAVIATLLLGITLPAQDIPKSEEQRLITAFKQALAQHNLEQLRKLVCWDDATKASHDALDGIFNDTLAEGKPMKVEIGEPDKDMVELYNNWPDATPGLPAGSHLNLPLVKILSVWHDDQAKVKDPATTNAQHAVVYTLGVKDGKLYLTCFVPPGK